MVKRNVPLSLHHWNYEVTNPVLGEVDGNNVPYLSYWVDRELSGLFSQSDGRVVLPTSNPGQADLEELAVLNGDGSVNIMVANHAVGNCPDSTGVACAGLKMSAAVTASGFSLAGSQMAILDSAHFSPQWVPFGSTIDFAGYGVAFLTTTGRAPSLSVSETHAGNFVAGTTNTYTIGIQNTGTSERHGNGDGHATYRPERDGNERHEVELLARRPAVHAHGRARAGRQLRADHGNCECGLHGGIDGGQPGDGVGRRSCCGERCGRDDGVGEL